MLQYRLLLELVLFFQRCLMPHQLIYFMCLCCFVFAPKSQIAIKIKTQKKFTYHNQTYRFTYKQYACRYTKTFFAIIINNNNNITITLPTIKNSHPKINTKHTPQISSNYNVHCTLSSKPSIHFNKIKHVPTREKNSINNQLNVLQLNYCFYCYICCRGKCKFAVSIVFLPIVAIEPL